MAQTRIDWKDGEGQLVASYQGVGSGPLRFSSTVANEGLDKEQRVTVVAKDEAQSVDVLVRQSGLRQELYTSEQEVFKTADDEVFAVLKEQNGVATTSVDTIQE